MTSSDTSPSHYRSNLRDLEFNLFEVLGLDATKGWYGTALTGHLMAAERDPARLYLVGLGSVRFLLAVGDLLIGWQLLHQAEVATAASAGDARSDAQFYRGKIAAGRFFARTVLPMLSATRAVLSNLDNDVMRLGEAAF